VPRGQDRLLLLLLLLLFLLLLVVLVVLVVVLVVTNILLLLILTIRCQQVVGRHQIIHLVGVFDQRNIEVMTITIGRIPAIPAMVGTSGSRSSFYITLDKKIVSILLNFNSFVIIVIFRFIFDSIDNVIVNSESTACQIDVEICDLLYN
jgi:hypothetical protein